MSRIIPFIFLGIMIVIFVVGIVLLSYLLVVGAVVGLVLFAIVWVKEKLFNKKNKSIVKRKPGNQTIDHDDL